MNYTGKRDYDVLPNTVGVIDVDMLRFRLAEINRTLDHLRTEYKEVIFWLEEAKKLHKGENNATEERYYF